MFEPASPTSPPDADDEELVRRARAGDDRAIDTLLARYRPFTRARARSYFLAGADREDIVQEGMIGLFKAVLDYEDGHNVGFGAFAELCITRQILTAIKSSNRRKHLPLNSYLSLYRAAGRDDEDGVLTDCLVSRSVADPADLVIAGEDVASLRATINRCLSTLEAEVLRLYVDGRTYQEIADSLGRHVKSIDNALQRIKRKLEQHLRLARSELA